MISKTINQFTKHLKHIYLYFLIAWIVPFLAIFILAKLNVFEQINNQNKSFQYFVPIFCFTIIIIGYLYFYQKIERARKEKSLSSKLDEYGYAYINKISFLAGTELFAATIYLLTRDVLYLSVIGMVFILFLFERFSKKRMVSELKINNTEKESLNDPNFKVDMKDRGYFQKNPWALIPMVLFLLYLIYDGIKGLI